jgi:hypothetical protein
MPEENKNIFLWDWRKAVKWGVVLIVVLYITRVIYSVYIANTVLNVASDMAANQQKKFTQLHASGSDEIKKVQDGITNGAKEMDLKVEEFHSAFADFEKSFLSEIDEARKRMRDRRRKKYTNDFLKFHASYYDQDSYELERKKAIDETGYKLPDYAAYNALRDKAMQCNMRIRNREVETQYKNEIAELKYKHQRKWGSRSTPQQCTV